MNLLQKQYTWGVDCIPWHKIIMQEFFFNNFFFIWKIQLQFFLVIPTTKLLVYLVQQWKA